MIICTGTGSTVTAVTGIGSNQCNERRVPPTVMCPLEVRADIPDRCTAVRWSIMAGDATGWISTGIQRMAFKATHPDPTDTIQGQAMTKSAGIQDVASGVVPWPDLRVGIVGSMAAFAAIAAYADDTDIELWVAAGATGLTMADLASCQVCFGLRAVVGTREVTAVQWVRHVLRTLGMAGAAVETGTEAAGCRLTAPQVLTVAGGAGIKTVQRGKAPVIDVGIRPGRWVEGKRWFSVVRMAAEAADGIAAAAQIRSMTGGAIVIAGIDTCFSVMGGEPALRMGVAVTRGIRPTTGAGTQEQH